ncbi:MAG: hypothetical protein Q7T82_15505 [Armatimonadota bacterium]|nr:hypothetical protein [Armatimonadota bacterium]
MVESRLKFLADENIPPVLVTILRKLNEKSIESMHGSPYAGQPDEVWLPSVIERGYICLTCDRRMLAESGIAQILIDQRATMIFLGPHFANSRPWDQAIWLLKYWRKIKEHAATMSPGRLVRVHKNGRIVPVTPTTGSRPGHTAQGGRPRKAKPTGPPDDTFSLVP